MSEAPHNTMEGRARRRASPSGMRTRPIRVEPEPPPTKSKRHEQGTPTRVAVVYYLCRNHQLEYPHFMEVPLTSPRGLYLRDVINRLDTLRGKGMAGKYSWSCKRRYKNGFVWHDLSEGDLLLPAHGAEYVLKGSELQLDQSTPDHRHNSGTSSAAKVPLPRPSRQQESPCSPTAAAPIMKEAVAPSPPAAAAVSAIKDTAHKPALPSSPSASTIGYDEPCRMPRSGSSSDSSPKTSMSSSGASSPGLNNPAAAHDAATQTDNETRGDASANSKPQQGHVAAGVTPERPEIVDESRSMGRPAGEHPSRRRSGTLQSLIRAEAAGRRRGVLEEEDERTAATTTGSVSGRLKPANLLMRLMACGPPNNPGIGFVQTSDKPRFTRLEYLSSPELSPLSVLEPGTAGAFTVRGSETENYSGGLRDSGAGKIPSSSRSDQNGVHDGAHSSKRDSVSLSRSTSKRMSGEMTPSAKTMSIEMEER